MGLGRDGLPLPVSDPRRAGPWLAAAVSAVALFAAGCGGDDGGSPAKAAAQDSGSAAKAAAQDSGSAAKAAAQDDPSLYRITDKGFDRTKFSDPTTIDNKFFPLPVGTQFVYEGRSNRGQGRRRHRVIFTVTDLSKVIDGVRTRVMWDRDINAGRLLEGELAFFAQDDDGHVWAFGEYPEEYEPDGSFGGAPDTWIVGRERARAGLHMRADPRPGTPSYLQGWAPAIEFSDRAKVLRTGRRACVPTGCYRDVLVTDETNPLEPADGHQLKFYAPGVGNIRAAPGRGGKEREVLELVELRRLGEAALAKVREEALKLERRAYREAEVYKGTPRATPDS